MTTPRWLLVEMAGRCVTLAIFFCQEAGIDNTLVMQLLAVKQQLDEVRTTDQAQAS